MIFKDFAFLQLRFLALKLARSVAEAFRRFSHQPVRSLGSCSCSAARGPRGFRICALLPVQFISICSNCLRKCQNIVIVRSSGFDPRYLCNICHVTPGMALMARALPEVGVCDMSHCYEAHGSDASAMSDPKSHLPGMAHKGRWASGISTVPSPNIIDHGV